MNVFYFLFIKAYARQREEIFVKEYKFSQTFSGNPFTFSHTSKFKFNIYTNLLMYIYSEINCLLYIHTLIYLIYT